MTKIDKVNNTRLGFSINDCPLWLVKEFTQDAKKRYNDVYWVKLMDLVRKAEAYDAFISNNGLVGFDEEEDVFNDESKEVLMNKKNNEEKVLTMSGLKG